MDARTASIVGKLYGRVHDIHIGILLLQYYSMLMTFEWDEAKDRANQEKHGVSFEKAQGAFSDPHFRRCPLAARSGSV
jgi:hypothetical protein